MNKKYLVLLLFVIALVLITACAPVQQELTSTPKSDAKVETKQVVQMPTETPKQYMSVEVKELLDKSKTKVNSIYYKYRGPETGSNFHEFYVKGNKIKYKPARELQALDKLSSYDSIFIDKIAKTAQSYCIAAYCTYKGKKQDLNYGDYYILTPLDWIDVTEAKKIGEEVIDDRNTWKIETNKGILWIDTFYGIPLKAESSGKVYRFQQISVNSVQDADVMPS